MTPKEFEIYESAKTGDVRVYFDMDGVCVSIDTAGIEVGRRVGLFKDARPVKSIIRKMQKMHESGIAVCILSMCNYEFQRQEKLKWLGIHAPFIDKENIIIIAKGEPHIKAEFARSGKHELKALYIKELLTQGKISGDEKIFFVEDTLDNMWGMAKLLPQIHNVHVSALVE